jgi:hypothetical protein
LKLVGQIKASIVGDELDKAPDQPPRGGTLPQNATETRLEC